MMRADVKFVVDGREHRLSMTLGALERIAETRPALPVVYQALATQIWELAELRAVIDGGLHGSGERLTFGEVYDALGLAECQRIALAAMKAVFEADMGNDFAAANVPEESKTTPGSI